MDNLIVDPFGWAREPEGDAAIGGLRVRMAQQKGSKHPYFVKLPLREEVTPPRRWQRDPAASGQIQK
jgi:hypothetical protein